MKNKTMQKLNKEELIKKVNSLKKDLFNLRFRKVNNQLEDEPELVSEDPMGEGWFIKVKLSDISELDDLMDESAYQAFIED